MMTDAVASGCDCLDDARIGLRIPTDQKECRPNAFRGQCSEDFRRGRRKGAVVEGEYDFLLRQRQGLRKALEADAGKRLRIERHDARGAERILA